MGSLLRPPELLEARKNAATSPADLRSLEDTHVQRVIAKQKELGFELATDGELRRRNFMSDFTDAVDGFDLGDSMARSWKAGETKVAQVSSVTGIVVKELRQVRSLTGHEVPSCSLTAPSLQRLLFPAPHNFPPSLSSRVSPAKSMRIDPLCSGPSSTS